jgi:hypothetical protein
MVLPDDTVSEGVTMGLFDFIKKKKQVPEPSQPTEEGWTGNWDRLIAKAQKKLTR